MSVIAFLLLTFAVTWSCYAGAAALPRAGNQFSMPATTLLYVGTVAPSLIAMFLAASVDRPGALAHLLKKVIKARVHVRWYVFAVAYMVSGSRGDIYASTSR